MPTKFTPFNDRVLVRPDAQQQRISILAKNQADEEEPTTGTVLAAGPLVLYPLEPDTTPEGMSQTKMRSLLIGKRVHWNQYAGREIVVDGEKLLLLRFEELNGCFEEE